MATVHTYGTSFYVIYSLQYFGEKTFRGDVSRESQRLLLLLPEILAKTEYACGVENLLKIQRVKYSTIKIKFCFSDEHLTTGNQAVS